jgi:heme/copper-type cytochrome/quinol oxidase subunit 2
MHSSMSAQVLQELRAHIDAVCVQSMGLAVQEARSELHKIFVAMVVCTSVMFSAIVVLFVIMAWRCARTDAEQFRSPVQQAHRVMIEEVVAQ